MNKIGFILFSLFFSLNVFSQVKGVVYTNENNVKQALPFAQVRALQSGTYTETDSLGKYVLQVNVPDTIVFTAFGYYVDSFLVTEELLKYDLDVLMYSEKILKEVVIQARQKDYGTLKMKLLNTEVIGEGELRKAACCNLSETFMTNTSVDVNITDAVSGAKKIQMMGIDGVYTQIQFENIPYLRGLESSFGLTSIPGTWIESIQITKGTGSVVNGYESMAGQINLEFKKPNKMEKFYFNAFGNAFGRGEINIDGSYKINEKWHGAYFVHGAKFNSEIDQNKDGFRDVNLSENVSVFNRWKYQGLNWVGQFGVNAYYQGKTGGQIGYKPSSSANLYGVNITSNHIDVYGKLGYLFKNKTTRSLGLIYNAKYHETQALFGLRNFDGKEKRGYFNSIFEDQLFNPNHTYKLGVSFVYSDISQRLDSVQLVDKSLLNLNRLELVPGFYGEYTWKIIRMSNVFGGRLDYHSIYGMQFSPRFYSKYSVNENIDIRATAGKAFRAPNVIIDNISLLASSRNWVINNAIDPEISWNYGISTNFDFKIGKRKSSFNVDFYRTFFESQLVVDRDISSNAIYFQSIKNKSFSNTFQTELNLPILKVFDIRFTYKMLDVQSLFDNQMTQQMMTPKHRWLGHINYTSKDKKWEANITGILTGKMRMKMFSDTYGSKMYDVNTSKYITVNAQITYVYKKWDFYIGGENLTNYRLNSVIIDAKNPFSENFDATMVWAPITGVNIYGGLRYTLKHEKNSPKSE